MRAPTSNRINQGQHGTSKAVDYSAKPDPTVYACESGRIDSYQQRGSGTSNAGNVLRLATKTGMWNFCHLERSLVSVGQQVTEGQPIAIMGYTGYTIPAGPAGAHLHCFILTPNGYVYPPTLFNQKEVNVAEKLSLSGARILAEEILGRDRDATHSGKGDGDLNANHVGKDLTNAYLYSLWTSDEAKNASALRQAQANFYNTYKNSIAELSGRPTKAQLEEVGKQLAESQKAVTDAEKALAEAKAKASEDTKLLDETGNWLTKLFNRLFGRKP